MPSALTIVEFEGKFEWKLAEYENEPTYTHVVEIAKSGGPDVASERQIHPSVLPGNPRDLHVSDRCPTPFPSFSNLAGAAS